MGEYPFERQTDRRSHRGDSPKKRQKRLTRIRWIWPGKLFDRWTELDRYLLVKYIDGNLKSETEPGKFLDNGNGRDIPDKIQFPGYTKSGNAP